VGHRRRRRPRLCNHGDSPGLKRRPLRALHQCRRRDVTVPMRTVPCYDGTQRSCIVDRCVGTPVDDWFYQAHTVQSDAHDVGDGCPHCGVRGEVRRVPSVTTARVWHPTVITRRFVS